MSEDEQASVNNDPRAAPAAAAEDARRILIAPAVAALTNVESVSEVVYDGPVNRDLRAAQPDLAQNTPPKMTSDPGLPPVPLRGMV